MSLSPTYEIVKNLLATEFKYRDDSQLLVCRIWDDEIKAKGLSSKSISALEFLILLRDKKLTSSESICRLSRKCQQDFPALRGRCWSARHGAKEEEVLAELRSL
jgi:hypothetical protein